MNIKNNSYWLVVRIVIVLSLVAVSLVGCKKGEDSSSVGVISNVTMAAAVDSNDRPLSPTSLFTVDTEAFYCSLKLSHFPPDTKIRAEWVYVGGEAVAEVGENRVLQSDTGTIGGDGYTSIAFQRPPYPDYKWPKGDYKVVLSVGDEEKASASFKVE